jgi:cobalt-zinc-cadmium efflux system membrane fusion protein
MCRQMIITMSVLLAGFWSGITYAEDGHDNHDESDDLDEHGEALQLSSAEREEFGVKVMTAGAGELAVHVRLPGEVRVNPDRLAHMVARVSGVARKVLANVGEQVRQNQVMAVLESRELSELKSAYLVARERLTLAQTTFAREEKLWDQEISSERMFLEAQKGLVEARIEQRVAEQKLHALGFAEDYLANLSFENDASFTRYEMAAPFGGTVIRKHLTLGEVLKDDTEAFVIADLRSVWVELTAYQKDLPFLRLGQSVLIHGGPGGGEATGTVGYISPIVDEATRTASARVVLPNLDGLWRPGSFVTATIDVDRVTVPLLVPKSALQIIDNQGVVFIETDEGFEPQPVSIGRTNQSHAEVLSGLQPGQRYVAEGAFTLKAQLSKGAFGDGHGH